MIRLSHGPRLGYLLLKNLSNNEVLGCIRAAHRSVVEPWQNLPGCLGVLLCIVIKQTHAGRPRYNNLD
jgi:hypothetical protein